MPGDDDQPEDLLELYAQAIRDLVVSRTRCNVRQQIIDELRAEVEALKGELTFFRSMGGKPSAN